VLINLFLNSLDVMPRGGLLEIDMAPDDKGHVQVRVLDSGPGIAANVLPRLFEPFVSGKETGLGLGLVVSRRIAEAHGGELWGRNRPEGGACFTLQLPLPAGAQHVQPDHAAALRRTVPA
jgi:two-component system sensor histidine kinase HydH